MARRDIQGMADEAKGSVRREFEESVSAIKGEIDGLKRSTLDSM